ncbi:MAG: hypothetical protein K2N00_09645 [Lachnospiraceae bacterium]|nr:hypothetical protein [Lachnospiraceae bacterium]
MKNRKWTAIVGVMLSLGMMMAGCAGTDETPKTEVRELSMEDVNETKGEEPDAGETEEMKDEEPEADVVNEAEESDRDAGKTDEAKQDASEVDEAGGVQTMKLSQGVEHLGGKVQSPQADGMILAQTTLLDEDGMVTLLEVEDAEKIPVRFTGDTKAEHWIIQGGGAGIDMKEAFLSDLEEGMGVELEGYFEGEDFVATRVIIEEYV